MKKFLFVLVILFLLLICCGVSIGGLYLVGKEILNYSGVNENITFEYYSGNNLSKDKILLIKINGIIIDTRDQVTGLFSSGYIYGYEIKDTLYKAAEDDSIKGVLMLINSGGGTVLGSRAIVDGIDYYKDQTKKPVYAYIQGFSASGAYMVTSACDYVISDYGSLTGSIGVIFGTPFQYYDKVTSQGNSSDYVVTQNGIETFYISAGEYKDMGNPYRKMSSEELASLQENINNEYNKFVELVSNNRSISQAKIKNEIKALIYGNDKAKLLNLIDEEGTYEYSMTKLLEKVGISDYQVITTKTDSFWSSLLYTYSNPDQTKLKNQLQNRVLMIYGDPFLYE